MSESELSESLSLSIILISRKEKRASARSKRPVVLKGRPKPASSSCTAGGGEAIMDGSGGRGGSKIGE